MALAFKNISSKYYTKRDKKEDVDAPTPLPCHLSAVTVGEETTVPRVGRIPRPKASGRVFRARSPSPCPFANFSPPEQMEQFPVYEGDEKEWEEWKGWNEASSVSCGGTNHCTQHCENRICRTTIHIDKKRYIVQRGCQCNDQPLLVDASLDNRRASHLTPKDVTNARCTYDAISKDTFITINLNSSTSLVGKLRDIGVLDLRSHLRSHRHFTPSTIYNRCDYRDAARSANHFIDKLLLYFQTMLLPLPGQKSGVSIMELDKAMKEAMRVELFWWMSEWCLPNSLKKWDNESTKAAKLFPGFSYARKLWVDGRHKEGVKALLQRIEEVIETVVSVLVWWSAQEEQGSCEMTDQVEEDAQTERHRSWKVSSESDDSGDLDENSDSD